MGRQKPNKPRRERRPAISWRGMDEQQFTSAVDVGVETATERNAVVVLELCGSNDMFELLSYETLAIFFRFGFWRASTNQSLVCIPDVLELEGMLSGMPSLEKVSARHLNGRSVKAFICPDPGEITAFATARGIRLS